jgi:hypothetical protein
MPENEETSTKSEVRHEVNPVISGRDEEVSEELTMPGNVWVLRDVLPPLLLQRLVSAEHRPNKEEQSFWLPVNDGCLSPPTTAVEEAVHYIFDNHMPLPIEGICGLEWWVHARDPTTYMHMHFDRDEGFFRRRQVMRHPVLSSVFYMNCAGGPTLVVDQRVSSDFKMLKPTIPLDGVACSPHTNQILFFPGDRLHGVLPAPPEFRREGDYFVPDLEHYSVAAERLTLMINFWTRPLEDETCVAITYDAATRLRYGHSSPGGPSPIKHTCTATAVSPHTYGPEVREIYFYDHSSSRQP